MSPDDSYALVDDALMQLRRLWSGSTASAAHGAAIADHVPPVEMSTVLVVDAIHRLQITQPGSEVTVAAVARRLGVAGSTASRLVDRAVTSSMVTRGASSIDTRRVALTLSSPGQTLVTSSGAFRRSYLAQMLEGWTVGEVDTFAELMGRFATAVHLHPPERQRRAQAGGVDRMVD
jgi:DNA-binding MarR family transcriptional regulator